MVFEGIMLPQRNGIQILKWWDLLKFITYGAVYMFKDFLKAV